MGVLNNKDLLSTKFTTAIIINSDNRAFFVPIKYVLGEYFIAKIDKQFYCFRLEGSRQIIYRHTLVRSFRMYIFSTDNFMPLDPANINRLEAILKENTLPKVSYNMFAVLKLASQKEKHNVKEQDFGGHDLEKILEEIAHKENEYPEQVQNLTNFINELESKKIVTPVKRVTEFLENELLTTHPWFLGMMAEQHKRTDQEQKKMSNTPIAGKIAWMKIMLLVTLVVAVGVIGYIVYSSGIISGISLPGATQNNGGGALTQAQILQKYPTPEALKAAVDKGEIDYKSLPDNIKKMVDKAKISAAPPIAK